MFAYVFIAYWHEKYKITRKPINKHAVNIPLCEKCFVYICNIEFELSFIFIYRHSLCTFIYQVIEYVKWQHWTLMSFLLNFGTFVSDFIISCIKMVSIETHDVLPGALLQTHGCLQNKVIVTVIQVGTGSKSLEYHCKVIMSSRV